MSEHYCLVLCTFPDDDDAAIQLANKIVAGRLGACVNILPGITSVYPWKDQIETDRERLLLIKTTTEQYAQLETFIKSHHPYELPEIIAVPIKHGSTEYLNWIDKCLNSQAQ